MEQHCPTLDMLEIDLLTYLVKLDPNKRITVKQALMHPYFDSLDKLSLPINYENQNFS